MVVSRTPSATPLISLSSSFSCFYQTASPPLCVALFSLPSCFICFHSPLGCFSSSPRHTLCIHLKLFSSDEVYANMHNSSCAIASDALTDYGSYHMTEAFQRNLLSAPHCNCTISPTRWQKELWLQQEHPKHTTNFNLNLNLVDYF